MARAPQGPYRARAGVPPTANFLSCMKDFIGLPLKKLSDALFKTIFFFFFFSQIWKLRLRNDKLLIEGCTDGRQVTDGKNKAF